MFPGQDWFQLFDGDGVCVYELLAYTKAGALRDAHQRGYTDAVRAQRIYQHIDSIDRWCDSESRKVPAWAVED